MQIEKVGLMTPGDMGQAVAMQIKAQGFTVCTALDQRSERSRALAREAGLTDVGTVARLVAECDVVLSVMNPGAALDFAREAADALRASGRQTLIVDCNAIAPDTVHEIAGVVERAGGRFLDAGIIGPPPRGKAKTNLYVSGPGAADLEQLAGPQLVVHVVSERIADASALKMCYGALNKGTQALWLEVLIAAQRLGVDGLLEQQLRQSHQADLYDWALGQFPQHAAQGLSLGAGNARDLQDPRLRPASRRKCFRERRISIASSPARRSERRRRRTATRRGAARMSCDCWLKSAADHDRLLVSRNVASTCISGVAAGVYRRLPGTRTNRQLPE